MKLTIFLRISLFVFFIVCTFTYFTKPVIAFISGGCTSDSDCASCYYCNRQNGACTLGGDCDALGSPTGCSSSDYCQIQDSGSIHPTTCTCVAKGGSSGGTSNGGSSGGTTCTGTTAASCYAETAKCFTVHNSDGSTKEWRDLDGGFHPVQDCQYGQLNQGGKSCNTSNAFGYCSACIVNDSQCVMWNAYLPAQRGGNDCTPGTDCTQCVDGYIPGQTGCGITDSNGVSATQLCGSGCVGGNTSGGASNGGTSNGGSSSNGGSGGAPSCTPTVTGGYYECETSTFGACGYMYTKYGNKPALDYVITDSCGGFNCLDKDRVCDQTISGHVFQDFNRDGVQDLYNGVMEPNVNNTLATVISLSNSADGITFSKTTDANGNYKAGFGQSAPYAQIKGGDWDVAVSGPPIHYDVTTPDQLVKVSFSNMNPKNVDFGIALQQYTISGTVYADLNHDGTENHNDAAYAGPDLTVIATDQNGNVASTAATVNGTYTLGLDWGNTYTISIQNLPTNFTQTTTNPTFDLTGDNPADVSGQDIGITPHYLLQGTICTDDQLDGSCNGNPDFPSSQNVTITPLTADGTKVGTITSATYKAGIRLLSGTYIVSYSPPTNYTFTATKAPNKTVPPFTISIGQSTAVDASNHKYTCSVPPVGSSDASCYLSTYPEQGTSGDIHNLNFAISNINAWSQGNCTDLLLEGTGMDDNLPNIGTCTDSGTGVSIPSSYAIVCPNNAPGIGVYSGGANTLTFGGNGGKASQPNFVMEFPYSENFTPVSGINRTSYETFKDEASQAGITPVNLSGTDPKTGNPYCGGGGIADCNFEANLPDGVYIANGDMTINLPSPYTLPDPGNYKSYVFLINGTLTIKSKVLVPTTTAAVFAAKGDIYVNANVGEAVANYSSTSPDLEGLYSTDGDFWILSNAVNGACAAGGVNIDSRLNVVGSVIIGGTIHNERELCKYDTSCPVTTYTTNYSYLLNAPEFVKHKDQLWQETAPNGK